MNSIISIISLLPPYLSFRRDLTSLLLISKEVNRRLRFTPYIYFPFFVQKKDLLTWPSLRNTKLEHGLNITQLFHQISFFTVPWPGDGPLEVVKAINHYDDLIDITHLDDRTLEPQFVINKSLREVFIFTINHWIKILLETIDALSHRKGERINIYLTNGNIAGSTNFVTTFNFLSHCNIINCYDNYQNMIANFIIDRVQTFYLIGVELIVDLFGLSGDKIGMLLSTLLFQMRVTPKSKQVILLIDSESLEIVNILVGNMKHIIKQKLVTRRESHPSFENYKLPRDVIDL